MTKDKLDYYYGNVGLASKEEKKKKTKKIFHIILSLILVVGMSCLIIG